MALRATLAAARALRGAGAVLSAPQAIPLRGLFAKAAAGAGRVPGAGRVYVNPLRFLADTTAKPPPKKSNVFSIVFTTTMLGGAAASFYFLGRPYDDSNLPLDGEPVLPRNNHEDKSVPEQFYLRAKERLLALWAEYGNPTPKNLLPPVPVDIGNPYVLVLAVEDCLIHQEWTPMHGWKTIKRPHLDTFLQYCIHLFGEVVLFSDKQMLDSGGVLQRLDEKNYTHKLFRIHQRYVDGEYVKDLSLLDRDLKKVLLIDISKNHYRLQPENGVTVKPFKELDPEDKTLLELIPLLQAISVGGVSDVRAVIKQFNSVEDVSSHLAERRQFRKMEAQHGAGATPSDAAPKRPRNRIAAWLLPDKS